MGSVRRHDLAENPQAEDRGICEACILEGSGREGERSYKSLQDAANLLDVRS